MTDSAHTPPREFLTEEEEARIAAQNNAPPPGEAPHLEVGRRGEALACRYLWRRGFRILERNWRGRHGEIDVIAEKDGRIHIVEIKTRTSDYMGEPQDRVDADKRRALRYAAAEYLGGFRDAPSAGMQYDVLSQVLDDRMRPVRQTLIEEAF